MKNAVFGRFVELKGRMRARIKKAIPEKLVKIIEKRTMADRVCFLRNRFSMRGVGNILVCHSFIYRERLKTVPFIPFTKLQYQSCRVCNDAGTDCHGEQAFLFIGQEKRCEKAAQGRPDPGGGIKDRREGHG